MNQTLAVRGVSVALVLTVVAGYLYFTLSNASYTLGCDYLAYDGALRRLLSGETVYDLSITATGSCGIYQYPPAFLAMISPLALVPAQAATWLFIGACIAALVAGVALMPVPFEVRLITLALAGTAWPMLFAIKVGAVGPLLFLLFALSWRWRDQPAPLAASVAIGTLIKLQPGLLLVWMLVSRRWRGLVIAVAALAGVGVVGLVLDGQLWLDFATMVRQLSSTALDAGANVAPASDAYQLGLPAPAAQAVGVIHTVVLLAVVVAAARWLPGDAAILVAAVASQMVSPVMWDHYALVVFLPIAWLLARRQWWALIVGVALNATFILLVSPMLYVVAMDVVIAGVCLVARAEQVRAARLAQVPASS